ncbi:MAG: hypothetical protein IPJ50_12945 [Betaproteobacteria bacterium]|nr:hypothetical protein [Betaproteobacteria bacterium]
MNLIVMQNRILDVERPASSLSIRPGFFYDQLPARSILILERNADLDEVH